MLMPLKSQMTLRRWAVAVVAAFIASTSQAADPSTARATDETPNIMFILTDNLGYGELGAYGGGATRGAPTPRIDRLAAEGLRLTNMNMEAQCTPSRSSLQTGRFSIRSGTYAVPFGGVPDGLTQWEVTIGEALSAAGYATALYGKWHLGSRDGRLPNDQGYEASRARPTRLCGRRTRSGRTRSLRPSRSWKARRAKRAAPSKPTTWSNAA